MSEERREKGFTLIELIIVFTLIGILVGLSLPQYKNATKRAREAVLKEDLAIFRKLINQYYVDKGKYPESLQTLVDEEYSLIQGFDHMRKTEGYTLIILMFAIFVMSLGLMVAVPVWKTQIQREKEEELIFRGKQYVEAIRLFQIKKPGAFPRDFEELIEEKCLRKPYKDPMTKNGEWNVVLLYQGPSTRRTRPTRRSTRSTPQRGQEATGRGTAGTSMSVQKVLIAPQAALSSIDNPLIIGVVSASTQKSIKIYYQQDSYDKWLFYYGQDPSKMPEIVYYGQKEKD